MEKTKVSVFKLSATKRACGLTVPSSDSAFAFKMMSENPGVMKLH